MSNESELQELVSRWVAADQRGEPISVDALCAEHPHLREELQQRLAALKNGSQTAQMQDPDATLADPSQPLPTLPPVTCNSTLADLQLYRAGGLGAVYRATDEKLGREVAVKFIHGEQAEVKENVEQFRLEAEVTGRLEHPGIVPVYGLGHDQDDRIFYAMRFIEGQTLDEAIDKYHAARTSARDEKQHAVDYHHLLNSFVSVCKTIAYAHNRGIVHRDIKPQNVMLGRFGETLVVDWGLATPVQRTAQFKISGEHTLMPGSGSHSDTSSNSAAGTPVYMSPQQHSGSPADPASDIYSLGMTLYKLLTGGNPFKGCSLGDIRLKAMRGEIPRPRQLNPKVSPATEAICLKAISLDPGDRYETSLELAEDVENFLADEQVNAYKEPLTRRLARWSRRNRTAAQSLLIGLVVLVVVMIVSAIGLGSLARSESAAREEATEARGEAVKLQNQAQRQYAFYAAKSVAYELEYLREVLLESAANPEMRDMLEQWNATKDAAVQDRLQVWIVDRFGEKSAVANAANWFIVDIDGVQVCRAPPGGSINGYYGWRNYFHGGPKDLPVDTSPKPVPLDEEICLGAVYRAKPYGDYKVPLSAPIRSPDGKTIIGVFGIAIDLGKYPVLKQASVVLIDTRSDYLEGGAKKQGLILHHPVLADHLPGTDEDVSEISLPRLIDRKTLDDLDVAVDGGGLMKGFRDPLESDAAAQTVAYAPLQLSKAWPGRLQQPGWVVVVLERKSPAD